MRPGGPAAERALEIAVLDQRQRRVGVAPDVVAIGVDGRGQLQPHRFRRADQSVTAEDRPSEREREHRRRQHADARLVLPAGSEIAMSTMNSEMVKPIPDSAAPPAIRRSVSPGASSPSPVRAHEPGRPGDADELADHQTGDDPPRQR